MTQLTLFRANPFQIGSQNYRLLERLRRGPTTNKEMVDKMRLFKYGGHLSELRAKGFNVEGVQVLKGLWEYRLK